MVGIYRLIIWTEPWPTWPLWVWKMKRCHIRIGAHCNWVFTNTCWMPVKGLRSFSWHLTTSKASLPAQMVGIYWLVFQTEPWPNGPLWTWQTVCYDTSGNDHWNWVVTHSCWVHGVGLRSFISHVPNSKASLYGQMAGIYRLIIWTESWPTWPFWAWQTVCYGASGNDHYYWVFTHTLVWCMRQFWEASFGISQIPRHHSMPKWLESITLFLCQSKPIGTLWA